MADPQIGSGYNTDIAYRYKPGQTQAEFYSQKTGQVFGDPNQLASYVNSSYAGSNATGQNVFDVLAGGYRAQALSQVKNDLNSYQNDLYNTPDPTAKRQSSSITDSINSEQSNYDAYLKDYNDLKGKLEALKAPNYLQTYNDLANQQGIPQLNTQIGDLTAQRNNLPYVNRAASGNAGVETESQLGADTAQKDVPLYVQQQNAITRLGLAQDFINNSLKFKQMDADQARQSLTDAISAVTGAIDISRTHLNDLVERQRYDQQLQQSAQEFALNNAIDQPYYQIGNVIYDTATRQPKFVNNNGTIFTADGSKAYSKPEQFFKDSGINSFDEIYHINSTTVADKNAVLDLRQKYPDAGILATDSFTIASSKLKNSRIYQDQVRGPVGSGGGGGSSVLGLTNQQIDNISPLVTQFQNSPIVQNYNTIGEGYNFVKSLSSKTTNPADDQALIYALAKALDPGSVVREGEYATVQKYAQSMVQSYGKSVTQALNGSGFLSQDARTNIKNTIESRFKAAEKSYNNLYGETSRRINLIGNTDKGNELLNNYGGAFVSPTTSSSFVGPVNPNSQSSTQPTQQTQGFWSKTINWLFGD
jgi:hypothetical protein